MLSSRVSEFSKKPFFSRQTLSLSHPPPESSNARSDKNDRQNRKFYIHTCLLLLPRRAITKLRQQNHPPDKNSLAQYELQKAPGKYLQARGGLKAASLSPPNVKRIAAAPRKILGRGINARSTSNNKNDALHVHARGGNVNRQRVFIVPPEMLPRRFFNEVDLTPPAR